MIDAEATGEVADYAALDDHTLLSIIARESMIQTQLLVRIAAGLEAAQARFMPKIPGMGFRR